MPPPPASSQRRPPPRRRSVSPPLVPRRGAAAADAVARVASGSARRSDRTPVQPRAPRRAALDIAQVTIARHGHVRQAVDFFVQHPGEFVHDRRPRCVRRWTRPDRRSSLRRRPRLAPGVAGTVREPATWRPRPLAQLARPSPAASRIRHGGTSPESVQWRRAQSADAAAAPRAHRPCRSTSASKAGSRRRRSAPPRIHSPATVGQCDQGQRHAQLEAAPSDGGEAPPVSRTIRLDLPARLVARYRIKHEGIGLIQILFEDCPENWSGEARVAQSAASFKPRGGILKPGMKTPDARRKRPHIRFLRDPKGRHREAQVRFQTTDGKHLLQETFLGLPP